MRIGGIVLCGGRSSRMGSPKAWLSFGGEPMLARVVRIVREAVDPVVVVAAPGQDVPPLPSGVEIVRDEVEGRGPLGGLAAGLVALEGRREAAYLSSCDVPLLKAEFVSRVVGSFGGKDPTPLAPLAAHPPGGEGLKASSLSPPSFPGKGAGGLGPSPFAIAVPFVGGRLHPLAAAYSMSVLPLVRAMLAADRLRMTDLFAAAPTNQLTTEELAGVDPEFASLRNVNSPEEYAEALREHSDAR